MTGQNSAMHKLALMTFAALSLSACGAVPGSRNVDRTTTTQTALPAQQNAETRQCLAQLGDSGTRYSPLPDRYYGNGCATRNTVQLSALRGDRSDFDLSNLGPVACPLANKFASWARYGVDRAARQILGSELARIETMGSYSCRNVAGSTRRSAHSRAEAIDVSAFVLANGRRITLSSDWDGGTREEREFLRIVHRSACKRFGTVLGPDYNQAHKDHFHLEQGDGSFCR